MSKAVKRLHDAGDHAAAYALKEVLLQRMRARKMEDMKKKERDHAINAGVQARAGSPSLGTTVGRPNQTTKGE